MFVTSDIRDVLDGSTPTAGFPDAEAMTVNDRYMVGHLISVSRARGRGAVLKKIDNADAVWSFAYRKPRPGWRLIGRFMERDVFIGLSLKSRSFLGHRESAFTEEACAAVEAWNRLLPGLDPVRSDDVEELLSPLVWDLDNDDD